MPDERYHPSLQVEEVGQIWAVKFTTDVLVDTATIREIGLQLNALVEKAHQPRVVVNFAGVSVLSSTMIGHLIGMHRKAEAARGRVVLCGIAPDLYKVFKITGMDRVLKIYAGESEALQAF